MCIYIYIYFLCINFIVCSVWGLEAAGLLSEADAHLAEVALRVVLRRKTIFV